MQIRIPQERTEQAMHLAHRIGREPFRKRSWAELGFFLVSSALACAAAFVLAALAIAGVPLTVVFVGIVILAGGLRAARLFGRWQRATRPADAGRGDPRTRAAPRPSGLLRVAAGVARRSGRLAGGGLLCRQGPLTIFGVWFALSVWVEALFSVAAPLTGSTGTVRFGAFGRLFRPDYYGGPAPRLATHAGVFLSGVVLLFVAPWTMRLVVYLDRRMMHLLLGPDASASRLRSLEESRSKTLDAAAETLRRIERNLHDGTQAQLVALAMRLGQAKEKLDHLAAEGQTADMAAIQRLVDEAHRGAKEAITDLRDLARGIHPPALDTGLENALATLAARSSIPTDVAVAIQSRPSRAIEAISYFCAAELLANVAQHAQASRAVLSAAPSTGRGCESSCATTGAAVPPSTATAHPRVAWPASPIGSAPSTGASASPARRVALPPSRSICPHARDHGQRRRHNRRDRRRFRHIARRIGPASHRQGLRRDPGRERCCQP